MMVKRIPFNKPNKMHTIRAINRALYYPSDKPSDKPSNKPSNKPSIIILSER